MYIAISKQHQGENFKGSVRDFVNYLEKENEGKSPELQEQFFDQYNDGISGEEVITEIDNNIEKLGKKDPKFYSIVVSPSKSELRDGLSCIFMRFRFNHIHILAGLLIAFLFCFTSCKQDKDVMVAKYKFRPFEELYDIGSDPLEMVNLAENPEYESTKQRLQKELASWMKSQGDKGLATEMTALSRQERKKTWVSYNTKLKE